MKYTNSVRHREQHSPVRQTVGCGYLSILVLSVALQLIVAGCGSDDDSETTESLTTDQGYGGASEVTSQDVAGSGAGNSNETIGESPSGSGGENGSSSADPAGGGGGRSASSAESGAGGATAGTEGGESGSNIAAGEGGDAGLAGVGDDSGQSDASGNDGEAEDGGTEQRRPSCLANGSQVVLIGDSYINWITHTFPQDMNNVVGQPVRNYAIGGFSMASGGLGFIPPQLDLALADDPDIIAVVMSGGGNDILIPDILQFPQGGECKNDPNSASIPDCQAIVKLAVDTAIDCMDNLVDAGIPDVIYFFYPKVPSTWLAADPNGILEYALPLAKDACDSAYDRTDGQLTCHFVDLIPVFEGHPEYFAEADLHENSVGSAAMAEKIWEVMVDNCIAQPESSGCCAP